MRRSSILPLCSLLCILLTPMMGRGQGASRVVFDAWYHSRAADSAAPEWTVHGVSGVRTPVIERAPRRMRLLGRFGGGDTLRLRITDLPRHQRLRVDVGVHIIGSWDGVRDDDRLRITLAGSTVIDASFSNTIDRQSFPALRAGRTYPPRTGARNRNMLGYRFTEPGVYNGPMDASYVISGTIDHTAPFATLDISAKLRDVRPGLENESWGIEHVTVSIEDRVTDSERPTALTAPVPDDVLRYDVQDERVVAGYTQDDDFPGLVPGTPLERDLHLTLLRSECNSCGEACLMYVYTIYSDRWVNVWSNKPAKGPSSWYTQLTEQEFAAIRSKISACLAIAMAREYHDAAIEEQQPGITHCQIMLRDLTTEQHVLVHAGEPPELRDLMQLVMSTLREHGWVPIPH
jgi:hypothetical protein